MSHLLAMMLKRMDDLTLFSREDSLPDPFILLDGHGSRFDLPFLEYINNDQHKWTTCMVTPYGTNKWQVGDSLQQNRSFKMEIGKGKMALLKEKTHTGHKFQLTKKDIAWLLCFVWTKSFGFARTNKTEKCERGWNPLNRACLDDYEIQNSHDHMDGRGDSAYRKVLATGSQLADIAHLNTTHGVSGESFVKFPHDKDTRQIEEDVDPLLIQQKRRETATA
jgi:hypothetical protein